MRSNLLIILSLALLFVACDPQGVYEENVQIPESSWHMDSVATFSVHMADTLTVFNVKLNIRNTTSYPNSNLYLFVTTHSPGGAVLRDTVECFLANEKGKWLGRGVGRFRDSQVPYKMYVRLPEVGTYTFVLQQGMRMVSLPGIHSVGVRIEKSSQ